MEEVAVLLLVALSIAIRIDAEESSGVCDFKPSLKPRPHSVSILEFGATRVAHSFMSHLENGLLGVSALPAILHYSWKKGAVILGSQDPSHWDLVYPLSSYGRGIELPGKRYQSLTNGDMLYNVAVTGDNGTTDGQGYVWWDWFESDSLNYSRPHLVEFTSSALIMS
ncbi:hypothetical protein OIU84_021840 [Salix udensis]|uniref:Uncharacterized protein n=1 Tax=Salix udensis TaxID=889485 RepID=A0AAD6KVX5_9ROSI|nr:hypothetical protein OIU84_021840 [Salix udensis]